MWIARTGILASGGVIFDIDALAFINATGITDTTQKNAINNLVNDIKGGGFYNKFKAIYPLIGGSSITNKYNLVDPRNINEAFRLSFVNGWTHSSTGSLPNGTDAYADTFLNALSTLTNNNYAFGVYTRTQSNSGIRDDMRVSATNSLGLSQYRTSNFKTFLAGNTTTQSIQVNNTNTLGMLIGTRTSSTSAKMFMNGVQQGSTLTTANTTNLPNNKFYVGANNGGGVANNFSDKELAFAFISNSLSDAEVLMMTTAVNKFQTALGRNVY
jgi:hypothetical protein